MKNIQGDKFIANIRKDFSANFCFKWWMLFIGIILWISLNIQLTQYFTDSTPLLTHFKLSIYPMMAKVSWLFSYPSVSTVVHLHSILTQAISPTTLFRIFPFFSTYLDASLLLSESETVTAFPIKILIDTSPKLVPMSDYSVI